MIPDSLFSPSQSPVFVLLKVLVSPFSKHRKQRNDTKPSRRSWLWSVPKWNMILFRVRPQPAVARLAHLKAVVSARQLLPGLVANVLVHSNVKHAVIARPATDKRKVLVFHCSSSNFIVMVTSVGSSSSHLTLGNDSRLSSTKSKRMFGSHLL